MLAMTILPMTNEDLPSVIEIEKLSAITPFAESQFQKELNLSNAHLYVAKIDNKTIGYIDFWHTADEVELINIAVHPDFRKEKVGTRLMDFLVRFVAKQKVSKINLEVRKSNRAAIHLYKQFGFKQVGVREKYYRENGEDALTYVRSSFD
jgi:[ribosomal protein S18]-alanine N-acetyltransferase